MKKPVKYLASLFVVFLGSFPAIAAENLEVDPNAIILRSQPASGARGILFRENMESLFSIGYIRYTKTSLKGASGAYRPSSDLDYYICNTWADINCKPSNSTAIDAYSVLGNCISDTELGCVQSLKLIDVMGHQSLLKYAGPATANVVDIPEDLSLGIPRSSSRPIYEDASGNKYLVRASIQSNYFPDSPLTSNMRFTADVTPVVKVSDTRIEAPKVTRGLNNISGMGIVSVAPTFEECLAIDSGYCYKALKHDLDSQLFLQVRVPTGVSGWINGRLSEPKISLEKIGANSQLITISAKPAKMPVAGGWVKYSDLPENFMENLWPTGFYKKNPDASFYLVANPSSGDQGFKEYAAWAPFLSDKALATISTWSFATRIETGSQFCLTSGSEIAGIVASNASVYSSQPPTWDAANSTLSYQVASPHSDENGKENLGTYTLAMSKKAIQCLYGQNNLPPSATISIGYGSELVTVATVTLKSDSDWIYFAANGFHYSSPIIKVKFAGANKPSPSASTAPTASATKIQWCAKGNAKKKVVAVNPVCPKGYKKIKAPL